MLKVTKAAICVGAVLCAGEANAAATLFTFFTTGSGIQRGAPNALNPMDAVPLSDLRFTFAVDVNQPIFGEPGGTVGFAGSEISAGATANGFITVLRSGLTRGNFDACFSNPSSIFPTYNTEIIATCGGDAVFTSQGRPNGFVEYTGTVTKLVVAYSGEIVGNGFVGFSTAVPEPFTWALMLTGFGMVGYAIRRRRPQVVYA